MESVIQDTKPGVKEYRLYEVKEQIIMHPDDYEAHLAWVIAKRFHEMVLKETFGEKPVTFQLIGTPFGIP